MQRTKSICMSKEVKEDICLQTHVLSMTYISSLCSHIDVGDILIIFRAVAQLTW